MSDTYTLDEFAERARERFGLPKEITDSMQWRTPREAAKRFGLDSADPFQAVVANYKHLAELRDQNNGDWNAAVDNYYGAPNSRGPAGFQAPQSSPRPSQTQIFEPLPYPQTETNDARIKRRKSEMEAADSAYRQYNPGIDWQQKSLAAATAPLNALAGVWRNRGQGVGGMMRGAAGAMVGAMETYTPSQWDESARLRAAAARAREDYERALRGVPEVDNTYPSQPPRRRTLPPPGQQPRRARSVAEAAAILDERSEDAPIRTLVEMGH